MHGGNGDPIPQTTNTIATIISCGRREVSRAEARRRRGRGGEKGEGGKHQSPVTASFHPEGADVVLIFSSAPSAMQIVKFVHFLEDHLTAKNSKSAEISGPERSTLHSISVFVFFVLFCG